jgi:hypothetical protein
MPSFSEKKPPDNGKLLLECQKMDSYLGIDENIVVEFKLY